MRRRGSPLRLDDLRGGMRPLRRDVGSLATDFRAGENAPASGRRLSAVRKSADPRPRALRGIIPLLGLAWPVLWTPLLHAATFQVNTTLDLNRGACTTAAGGCSLREA